MVESSCALRSLLPPFVDSTPIAYGRIAQARRAIRYVQFELSFSIVILIENHLLLFSIGHVGIVVLLLVVFFKKWPVRVDSEPKANDNETFDYETEQGAVFRPHSAEHTHRSPLTLDSSEDAKAEEAVSIPEEPQAVSSGAKIAFVQEPEPEVLQPENEEQAEPDTAGDPMIGQAQEPEEPPAPSLQERRKERILEVFSGIGTKPVIAIGRDETIFDLNDHARHMLGYASDDIEGRRIDEVIFLEDSGEAQDGTDDAHQSARAQCKDGSLFPLLVELEMADREFGIITVALLPKNEQEPAQAVKVALDSEGKELHEPSPSSDHSDDASTEEEKAVEETGVAPPADLPSLPPPPFPPPAAPLAVSGPALSQPIPPPPRRRPLPPLSPSRTALAIAGQGLDSKTVEMFASNLSQPLQSIAQLAALIAADDQSIPHLKKYAVAIQAKSNRILSQIEEMSVLVSAQKGDIQRKDRPFNLSRTLSSLVELASSVVNSQQQRIHFKREEQDLIVLSDEGLFEKVISNLINLSLQSAEHRDITLVLESNMISVLGGQETSISFDGQKLQIDGTREVSIRAEFPSDPNTNRFFDIAIHRADTSLINKLQASNALKNLTTTIRLMKELAHGLGGQFSFRADQPELGIIVLKLQLSSAEVAAYPSE